MAKITDALLFLSGILFVCSLYGQPRDGCVQLLVSSNAFPPSKAIDFAKNWAQPHLANGLALTPGSEDFSKLAHYLMSLNEVVVSDFSLKMKLNLEWKKLGTNPQFEKAEILWRQAIDRKFPTNPSQKMDAKISSLVEKILNETKFFVFAQGKNYFLPHLTEAEKKKFFVSTDKKAHSDWAYDRLLGGTMTLGQKVTLASEKTRAQFGIHQDWSIPPLYRSRELSQVSDQWLEHAFVLPNTETVPQILGVLHVLNPKRVQEFIDSNRWQFPSTVRDYKSLTEFNVTQKSRFFYSDEFLFHRGSSLRMGLAEIALRPDQAENIFKYAFERFLFAALSSNTELVGLFQLEFFNSSNLQRVFEHHVLDSIGIGSGVTIHSVKSMTHEDLVPEGILSKSFEEQKALPAPVLPKDSRRLPPKDWDVQFDD